MVYDISKIFLEKLDIETLSLIIPQALEEVTGQDASFEVAQSNTLVPLRLIFKQNIVIQSQALVFEQLFTDIDAVYNRKKDKKDYTRSDKPLGKDFLPYLTDYLGIKTIHWYTNLGPSQTIEKLDLATNRSLRFQRINSKRNDFSGINLQVIIIYGPSISVRITRLPQAITENIDMLKEKGVD